VSLGPPIPGPKSCWKPVTMLFAMNVLERYSVPVIGCILDYLNTTAVAGSKNTTLIPQHQDYCSLYSASKELTGINASDYHFNIPLVKILM